jgi:hypothetical protein
LGPRRWDGRGGRRFAELGNRLWQGTHLRPRIGRDFGFGWESHRTPLPLASALVGCSISTFVCRRTNLAWSITCKLKGLDYMSEYDPLRDPAVLHELEALRVVSP